MSVHETHATANESKGIWALPLIALFIVAILLVAFTRPIFNPEEQHNSHEKTETLHKEGVKPH